LGPFVVTQSFFARNETAFRMNRSGFNRCRFNSAGSLAALPADLLSAIEALWLSTPSLTALVPGGLRLDGQAPGALPPYVLLSGVDEQLPGLSIEDEPEDATFAVVAASIEQAKAIGAAIRAVFDPNPARPQLAWTGGRETFNWRNDSTPRRLRTLGPGGLMLWRYDLQYRFWVNRT
jgi:hypothetical protein